MKYGLIGILFLVNGLAQATESAADSTGNHGTEFHSYIEQYKTPELFFNNQKALDARINLLRHVPAGGAARIMTFHADFGTAFVRLVNEMCAASMRGVTVQFTADSHSGDRVKVNDAHDRTQGSKNVEYFYEQLGKCGVEVRVHNHVPDELFRQSLLLGSALPAGSASVIEKLMQLIPFIGDDLNLVSEYKNAYSKMATVIKRHLREHAELAKIVKSEGDLDEVESLLWKFVMTIAKVKMSKINEMTEDELSAFRAEIQGELSTEFAQAKGNVKLATILDALKKNPDVLGKAFVATISEIRKDPDFANFYQSIRDFNRLNHRKLFWVADKPTSGDAKGCFIMGGRNLGDHYLQETEDNFLDGDVLFCSHHDKTAAGAIRTFKDTQTELLVLQQARVAFEKIWEPELTDQDKELQRFLKQKNSDFRANMTTIAPAQGSEKVFSVDARDRWAFQRSGDKFDYGTAVTEDRKLADGRGFKILTAAWDRSNDQIKSAFLTAIENEKQQIYIETPYFEANREYKNAIEAALERGVNVHIRTNGIFTADGPSVFIRLSMGNWVRTLLQKYKTPPAGKGRLQVEYTTLATGGSGGHMIHFKGASFACQFDENANRGFATNMMGSHNFHQRSGYSDKEMMISWESLVSQSCQNKLGSSVSLDVAPSGADKNLISDYREAFYQSSAKDSLAEYDTLNQELASGIAIDRSKAPNSKMTPARRVFTGMLGTLIYGSSDQQVASESSEVEPVVADLLEVLTESQILDFLGILM